MFAILKRELYGFFVTPIAYVYLAAVGVVSAVYYAMLLLRGSAKIGSEFAFLFSVTLLLTPVLTMRLLSEERTQNTLLLLRAAPVRTSYIVLGKYLAACIIYCMGLIFPLLHVLSMAEWSSVNWAFVAGNLAGLLLVGMACIAICTLISSLTENQIVAAIGGFSVMVFVLLLNTLASAVHLPFLRTVLASMSFYNSYYGLTVGILRVSDLFYFVTLIGLFLFLTIQSMESRRWSGC